MRYNNKIFSILLLLYITSFVYSDESPQLFVMLDVDSTIVERVNPDDKIFINELLKENYVLQQLVFTSDISSNHRFSSMYRKSALAGIKDDYMYRIKTKLISNSTAQVTEYVVIRPIMKKLLEAILQLQIKTNILICSRNDDVRNKHLVQHLNLDINGLPFKDSVDFVNRDTFRVEIISPDGKEAAAKSAALLREKYTGKYGKIKDQDFVVLIDQLPDSRFIVFQHNKDLNIPIEYFRLSYGKRFNQLKDVGQVSYIIGKIKEFMSREAK
jgi:hypothetical protein